MTDIAIVDFSSDYIKDALDILYESILLHAQNDPRQFCCPSKEKYIPYLNEILNKEKNFGLVALVGKQTAGILLGTEEQHQEPTFRQNRFYKIYDIVVSEKFKKRGLGKRLIEALKERAHNNGISQIELEVYSFNNCAMAFYKRLDFIEVSKTMLLEI